MSDENRCGACSSGYFHVARSPTGALYSHLRKNRRGVQEIRNCETRVCFFCRQEVDERKIYWHSKANGGRCNRPGKGEKVVVVR